MSAPAILLHGAWQGSWAWELLLPHLAAAGIAAQALDLPGNGHDDTPAHAVSLQLYVDHVVARIETMPSPVSLVAHSGAGVVASQVAERVPDRMARIVYVAGMMLPSGVSFAEVVVPIAAQEPHAAGIGPHLVWSADRKVSCVPPDAAARIFFHDAAPDLARAAALRLTPQAEAGRAVRPLLTAERFGLVPRFYVEAENDRSVVLAVQRRMQALVPGATVATLATGHAPQLAAPKKLADCLIPWLRAA